MYERLLRALTPPILLRVLERPTAHVYEVGRAPLLDWSAYQDAQIPATFVPWEALLASIPPRYRIARLFYGDTGWIGLGRRRIETRMVGFLARKA